MGKDADEVGELLLKVICPLVNRLNAYGLLLNRDYRTVWLLLLENSLDVFF